jgi:Icc-related predicted phosphoesterase
MRILAVADLHGAQYRLNLVLQNITTYSPDLVIICGDLTQFGPGKLATNFLNQIPIRTFAVAGNIDTFDVDQGINESNATNLDKRQVIIQDIPFIGIGREIPPSLPTLLIDDDTKKKPLNKILKPTSVLVTHYPPYKTQDKIFIGSHGGSKELRSIIDIYKPRLVLCGHIHEDPGITRVGDTTVVNCSIGKRTEGALIELTDRLKTSMLG